MRSENSTSTGGGLTIVARIFVVIEAAALVLLCLTLNSILPMRYLGIVIAIAVLILALQIVLVSGSGRMTGRSVFSILISILLIGGSVFVIFFMRKTEMKLSEMTENAIVTQQTTSETTSGQRAVKIVATMNVYARITDGLTQIEELNGRTLGALDMMDQENTDRALAQLNESFGAEQAVVKKAGILPLCNALKNYEVDAMIINAGYATSIKDNDPTFNDWAMLIGTIDVTKEVSSGEANGEEAAAASANKTSAAPVEDITTQPFLIYLTGMDTRTDATVADVGNSDVNMILAVNPVTKRLLMINIPRDTYYYLWGDSNYPDKLTHSGYYGTECSLQTVSSLFDMYMNYYVKVGFNSVINLVDALGGITVWSDYEFVIYDYDLSMEEVYIAPGENYLWGYEALMFARERESLPGGDRARGMNQQEVIKAIIAKITSAEWLPRFNEVLSAITSNVMTNISVEDMEALLKMQLNDDATWDIQSYSIDGSGGWDYCYSLGDSNDVMYPNWDTVEAAKAAIYAVLSGQ